MNTSTTSISFAHPDDSATTFALSQRPILDRLCLFLDICSLQQMKHLSPLFRYCVNYHIHLKLRCSLAAAQLRLSVPLEFAVRGEGYIHWTWPYVVTESKYPRFTIEDGPLVPQAVYQFQLEDPTCTSVDKVTRWGLFDRLCLTIPMEVYPEDRTLRDHAGTVAFFELWDEIEHAYDENISWVEEHGVNDEGIQLKLGGFILHSRLHPMDPLSEFSALFHDKIEVTVGLRYWRESRGNRQRVYLAEFSERNVIKAATDDFCRGCRHFRR
jgi:hypothetical protein